MGDVIRFYLVNRFGRAMKRLNLLVIPYNNMKILKINSKSNQNTTQIIWESTLLHTIKSIEVRMSSSNKVKFPCSFVCLLCLYNMKVFEWKIRESKLFFMDYNVHKNGWICDSNWFIRTCFRIVELQRFTIYYELCTCTYLSVIVSLHLYITFSLDLTLNFMKLYL